MISIILTLYLTFSLGPNIDGTLGRQVNISEDINAACRSHPSAIWRMEIKRECVGSETDLFCKKDYNWVYGYSIIRGDCADSPSYSFESRNP